MGQVKENLLTKGFSGKIGDEIVFRQVGNRTHFAKSPRKPLTKTARQVEHRTQFQQAVYYAKAALLDESVKEAYQEMARLSGLRSAYNAAVTDYLTEPKVASVHAGGYKGVAGDVIFIASAYPFKIHAVEVTIMNGGTVIETGLAVRENSDWKYITTQANASVASSQIVIKAKDRLGKETTFTKVL